MSKIHKALEMMREPRVGQKTREAVELPSVPAEPPRRTLTAPLTAPVLSLDNEDLIDAGLRLHDEDHDKIAHEFRRIKRPILKLSFDQGAAQEQNANVVMVASALPGAGKTFCAFNLAVSISRERDYQALLVDADVIKPKLSRSLGLDDRVGLNDYLLDPSVGLEDILVPSDYFDILVVPAGRKHPEATELLASRRMTNFVDLLSSAFANRIVIFDTPPLLLTNEAHVLSEHMGQIVVVIESGVSEQGSVTQTLEMLDRQKPINAILNKSRFASRDGFYGQGYGYYGQSYGYYGHENTTQDEKE